VTHHIAERFVVILLLVISTWWVVAPKNYLACIRRVRWLWMSGYPMTSKSWFFAENLTPEAKERDRRLPRYLRLWGLLLWVVLIVDIYCYRARLN
jgi:hypothetical protein